MTPLLKIGHDIVVNEEFGEQTDGLVRDVEARWGEYLITYENDHFEMLGLQPNHNPENVMNLLADNIRTVELRENPEYKNYFKQM